MDDLADGSIGRRLGYAMSEAFIIDALVDIKANEQARRQLSAGMLQRDRRLQGDVSQLYFNKTIFRNNAQGPTQGITTFGLITLQTEGHFLSLDNCLFAENIYGISETNVRTLGHAHHDVALVEDARVVVGQGLTHPRYLTSLYRTLPFHT